MTDPTVVVTLTEGQRKTTLAALFAYASETGQYLRSSGFTPCAPDCEHCAPRVAHFAEITAGLEQRAQLITEALAALSA